MQKSILHTTHKNRFKKPETPKPSKEIKPMNFKENNLWSLPDRMNTKRDGLDLRTTPRISFRKFNNKTLHTEKTKVVDFPVRGVFQWFTAVRYSIRATVNHAQRRFRLTALRSPRPTCIEFNLCARKERFMNSFPGWLPSQPVRSRVFPTELCWCGAQLEDAAEGL